MKLDISIQIYGDTTYRGKCPRESVEQITFISWVRREYSDSYGATIFHAKNEGKLVNGQFQLITKDKAMGMAIGCADIHCPGVPSFCMELKRKDHTKSVIRQEQINYLLTAEQAGAFVCVALGHEAAIEAFQEWIKLNKMLTKSLNTGIMITSQQTNERR